MSTRLTHLDRDNLVNFMKAWQHSMPRMFDTERSLESAMVPLRVELDTQIYVLPNGAYMLLRNAVPGNQAALQFISLTDEVVPELEAAKEQLQEAVQEYRLRRVDIAYPSHLQWRDFKLLGFKHEGRIRQSVLFDNEWSDVEILGALKHEVGITRRRRRKRYRPQKDNRNAKFRTTRRNQQSSSDSRRAESPDRPKSGASSGSNHEREPAGRPTDNDA